VHFVGLFSLRISGYSLPFMTERRPANFHVERNTTPWTS